MIFVFLGCGGHFDGLGDLSQFLDSLVVGRIDDLSCVLSGLFFLCHCYIFNVGFVFVRSLFEDVQGIVLW